MSEEQDDDLMERICDALDFDGLIKLCRSEYERGVADGIKQVNAEAAYQRGRDAKNLIETVDKIELPGLARENSRKPDEWFQLVERLTPGWRRADIFARESRDGWQTFGREKTKFDRK